MHIPDSLQVCMLWEELNETTACFPSRFPMYTYTKQARNPGTVEKSIAILVDGLTGLTGLTGIDGTDGTDGRIATDPIQSLPPVFLALFLIQAFFKTI